MKIGTVGTGFIVSYFIESAKDISDVEIAAVYSRTKEQADAFADKYDVGLRYTDRDAFLNSTEFDFVYVASPNSLHYQWSKDALLAGKNVICEKPFTSNLKESKELVELAREKGLFLFEAITVPHLPNFNTLKEHLDEIGQIKMVQLNFSQYSSRYAAFKDGKKPNVFTPEFSGGALMDINYYNLYFTVMLFGEPKNIFYHANIEEGIDTSGVLVMEYDGFLSVAVGCKDSKSENMIQIQGDKGYIVVPEESSRCISYKVLAGNTEAVYNIQEHPRAHFYELTRFNELYNNKDLETAYKLLDNSLLVMDLVDKARKVAGVVFPADNQ